jgi:hypothetical protein
VEVVRFGAAQFIVAVPGELTMDHTTLLQHAQGAASLAPARYCTAGGAPRPRQVLCKGRRPSPPLGILQKAAPLASARYCAEGGAPRLR